MDYAAWQRGHMNLEAELGWWQQKLAGAPPLLELPMDRPRPDVFSYNGDELRFSLPNAMREGLQRLAEMQQTTPFVVALSLLQVRTCMCHRDHLHRSSCSIHLYLVGRSSSMRLAICRRSWPSTAGRSTLSLARPMQTAALRRWRA